eukprot:SAG31_NODE_38282_length_297_cov_1.035354_1_plen_59_part_10
MQDILRYFHLARSAEAALTAVALGDPLLHRVVPGVPVADPLRRGDRLCHTRVQLIPINP